MTHEEAVSIQKTGGVDAFGRPLIDIRRDHLRPGGWATRNAAALQQARTRYEESEHARGVRQFYDVVSLRRYLRRLAARHAVAVARLADMGGGEMAPLTPNKWNIPRTPKDARQFVKFERERWAELERLYNERMAQHG